MSEGPASIQFNFDMRCDGLEIISGTEIANEIKNRLKQKNEAEAIQPCLAMVLVGDNRDSLLYVGLKKKALEVSGARGEFVQFPATVSLDEIKKVIERLNADAAVNGILVQLPLPGLLAEYEEEVLAAIDPHKDVDGFTPVNRGSLVGDHPGFISCAALACMEAVERVIADLKNKKVLLIGESFDVIKPLALMFIAKKCQVTVIPDFDKKLILNADVIVIEKGSPWVLRGEHLKAGTVVIDAGFYWHDGRTFGNVDIASTKECEGYLLPVPGGMGPLLIAKLMQNLNFAVRRDINE